jgi:hypothetical protein
MTPRKKRFQYSLGTAIITYNLTGFVVLVSILSHLDIDGRTRSSDYYPLESYIVPLLVLLMGTAISLWIGWRWEMHIRRIEEKDEIIKTLRFEVARLKQVCSGRIDPAASERAIPPPRTENVELQEGREESEQE